MSIFLIFLVFALGLSLLLIGKKLATQHRGFVGFQARYQSITLLLALALALVSGTKGTWMLGLGDLNAHVRGFEYLGATGSDRWLSFGTTFLVVMSVVTSIVVWLQSGRGKGIQPKTLLTALPVAAFFSVFNALTEELIFRVSLAQALISILSPWHIASISALIFGVIHYFGMPGKVPGMLMAGFMGWLLTFAVIQTGGIFGAWAIHFVQDIVILTIVFASEKARLQK